MNKKTCLKELTINFFIYLGIAIHISMILPHKLFGPGAQDIGIHLALILLLATRKVNFKKLFFNKYSAAFLLFFIMISLSSLLYSEFPDAMNAIRSRFKAVVLFFTVQLLSFSDKKSDNLFALALFPFFLVLISLGAFVPFLSGGGFGRVGGLRSFGLWHNRTARLWNIALTFAAATFFIVKLKFLKVIVSLFIILSLVGIPMTLSRTGTISLGIIILSFGAGILFKYRNRITTRQWIMGLIVVFTVAFTGLALNRDMILRRFESADWVSISGRTNRIWPSTLAAISDRPFIGYGYVDYTEVTKEYLGGRSYHHAHNLFLQVLFEGGVAAFLFFIYMLVIHFSKAWNIMKKEKSTFYGLSWLTVFIAVIIFHGMIANIRFITFSFFLSSLWLFEAYKRISGKKFPIICTRKSLSRFTKKARRYYKYRFFSPFYKKYMKRYEKFYKRYNPLKGPFLHMGLNMANRQGVVDIKRKFLYNRITKCANTTLMAALYEKSEEEKKLTKIELSKRYKKIHQTPSNLDENEASKAENLFKFVFVRNPYERVLSAYLDKIYLNPGIREKYRNRKAPFLFGKDSDVPSFYDFCKYIDRGGVYEDKHWTPQTSLLVIPPEEFDFIGKVENLQKDFLEVTRRVAALKGKTLPGRVGFASGASDKIDRYYDDKSIEIVSRLYREDFENFGYDFK